jgi:hypothetical protein
MKRKSSKVFIVHFFEMLAYEKINIHLEFLSQINGFAKVINPLKPNARKMSPSIQSLSLFYFIIDLIHYFLAH